MVINMVAVVNCSLESRPGKPRSSVQVGLEASQIAKEVIAQLAALSDAEVRVVLEIQARLPQGAPEHVVHIVTESCRTLTLETHGFEGE